MRFAVVRQTAVPANYPAIRGVGGYTEGDIKLIWECMHETVMFVGRQFYLP